VGAAFQLEIAKGEQSGLLMRIATTEITAKIIYPPKNRNLDDHFHRFFSLIANERNYQK
jgi:hypothetical protein